MNNFLTKLKYKFMAFMNGRYGSDILSRDLSVLSVVLFFLSSFFRLYIVNIIALAILILVYARTFSKNHTLRYRELNTYIAARSRFMGFFSTRKRMWRERKTHLYFRCKHCRTILRVPKGKGKIEVTCTICRAKLIKKT